MRHRSGIVLCLLAGSALAFAQGPQPPTALTVSSATNRLVSLVWTQPDQSSLFAIDRRVLDSGDDYAQLDTSSTAAYTDQNFDPFTAYQYRVRALQDNSSSDPSNEVTIGPPPKGNQLIAATPQAMIDNFVSSQFAQPGDMILDSNEDPAFVYMVVDPNMTGDTSNSELWFLGWNRAAHNWNPAVKIANVPAFVTDRRSLALAQDASNGVFAVAVEVATDNSIVLYESSDWGLTWVAKATFGGDGDFTFACPGLALGNGAIYFSYVRDTEGTSFVTGSLSDDPINWTRTLMPLLPGATESTISSGATRIALDAEGNPGLAFFQDDGDQQLIAAFWRPGWAAPVAVMDSMHYGIESFDAGLVFQGDNPRLTASMIRGTDVYSYDTVWETQSDDGGQTWLNPVFIPTDGGHYCAGAPVELSVDTNGRGAIIYNERCGTGDDATWGPNLSRSDDLVNWITSGLDTIDPATTLSFDRYTLNLHAHFASNNKLYVSWGQAGQSAIGSGLILWREP